MDKIVIKVIWRFNMDIKKHLIITGSSNISWKDAIVKAISEASKTIDFFDGML